MKTECLEIGIIQSFLDGELRNADASQVSTHLATCNICAATLARAEDESALVFSALGNELDTLVPTQRLWNRINESLAIEQRNASVWEKALSFVRTAFVSPSITVAAGLLIVAGVFALLLIDRSPVQQTSNEVAQAPASFTVTSPKIVETASPSTVSTDEESPSYTAGPRFERASYRTSIKPPIDRAPVATDANGNFMPGEESYVKTISSLTRTVEEEKVGVLSGSQRVSYERDMAVVNDAITKMRKELKRNPKNESAKQVLYSSYQNKIDLLNSVAQKEELVASLN